MKFISTHIQKELQHRLVGGEGDASQANSFLRALIHLQLKDVVVEIELHLLIGNVDAQLIQTKVGNQKSNEFCENKVLVRNTIELVIDRTLFKAQVNEDILDISLQQLAGQIPKIHNRNCQDTHLKVL